MIVNKPAPIKSNISNTQEFSTTTDSARLFRMLSDFLYSNKEACVLHEISANALDAHKLVGKENEPIHVYAPTEFNSSLRIRDFGPGLSEADVRKLLTTYGESGSHKRTSNEYLGSWGIGAKSPAAVTKTWDIRSNHNGVSTLYKVFVNERGIPALTKLTENQTDETGLEVSIPIDPTKKKIWIDLFSSVYEFYPVKPKFFGATPVFPEPKTIYQSTDWVLLHETYVSYSGLSVIISNRKYGINFSELYQFISPRFDAKEQRAISEILKNGGIRLLFGVGELELSISRESIQYTKYTIDAFESKIRIILGFFKDKFREMVPTESQINYKVSLAKYINTYFRKFSGTVELCLHEFGNPYDIRSEYDLNSIVITASVVGVKTNRLANIVRPKLNSRYGIFSFGVKTGDGHGVGITIGAIIDKSFMIVVKNVFNTSARIKHQIKLGGVTNILVITPDEVRNIPKELKGFIKKASTLTDPPRIKVERKINGVDASKDWYWLDSNYGELKFRPISKDEVESILGDTNLVYANFTKARQSSTVDLDVVNYKHLKSANDTLHLLGVRQGTNPPKNAKKVEDVLSEYELFVKSDYISYLRWRWFTENTRFSYSCSLWCDKLPQTSKIVEEYKQYSCISKETIAKYRLFSKINKGTNLPHYGNLFDIYPMLKYHNYDMSEKDFLEYVNLIDKELKNGKV
jgi:hypothetical protein